MLIGRDQGASLDFRVGYVWIDGWAVWWTEGRLKGGWTDEWMDQWTWGWMGGERPPTGWLMDRLMDV